MTNPGEPMKRVVYVAEPSDLEHQSEWFVMAHNLDDAGDVDSVAGPFPTETEATAEATRLQQVAEARRSLTKVTGNLVTMNNLRS